MTDPRNYQFFPAQEQLLRADKRYLAYISGVGAGKTFVGNWRTWMNMEKWNPGEMGAIVAPTRQMIVNVILPEMREIGFLDNWEYRSSRSEKPGLHAPNGSRALLLSADNKKTIERLRGLNLAWWHIDEKTAVPRRAQEILEQRLRVGNYRNGYITTTPKGKDDTYDRFIGGVDADTWQLGDATVYESDDKLAIVGVPSQANPHTPDDYKEALEKDHSGQTYEQEVMGKFVKFEGLVYKWFDEQTHVVDNDELPDHYTKTVYGLDFGGSVPSALVCARKSDGDWYLVDEFYESRVTDDTIAAEIQRMYDEHGRGTVYCDHEPRTIEKLKRESITAKEAEKAVDEGIRHINGLRENLYVARRCMNLINEFSQYQYKDGGDSDDVLKENDHAMDALRYALFSEDSGLTGGGVTIEW